MRGEGAGSQQHQFPAVDLMSRCEEQRDASGDVVLFDGARYGDGCRNGGDSDQVLARSMSNLPRQRARRRIRHLRERVELGGEAHRPSAPLVLEDAFGGGLETVDSAVYSELWRDPLDELQNERGRPMLAYEGQPRRPVEHARQPSSGEEWMLVLSLKSSGESSSIDCVRVSWLGWSGAESATW